nr:hypothetical protein [Tanacetum cinerariifolium]
STTVQKSRIKCYNCKEFGHVSRECQKSKRAKDAAYHMERCYCVSNDDHYNVFAMESAHPKQSESAHHTYPTDQDAHNVSIDSLDMSYDREEDDNDLAKELDACPNACEMWKAIEKLKQGESINVQDLETNLYWELKKFTSQDGESLESYYSRSQQAATRNRGKAIVNSPQPIYDQEPSMVAEDDETEEIDQNDDDNDLAKERELLASLIEKLKCEIDESKNRN